MFVISPFKMCYKPGCSREGMFAISPFKMCYKPGCSREGMFAISVPTRTSRTNMTPDESKAISALTGDPAKPFRVIPQTEGTVARSARVLSGVPGPSPGTGKVARLLGAVISRGR